MKRGDTMDSKKEPILCMSVNNLPFYLVYSFALHEIL